MRNWVFTTKPTHFKMSEALVPGEALDWPTFGRFKFEVGDLVFFYASSPVLQMIGKLEIEQLGLPFSEVNPRNDLRKWPRHHSNIPWMRLRVLQVAPVPYRPLQRGSLYYHTQFKPSPYPKLLHEDEREYVLRAFDEAMTFTTESEKYQGEMSPEVARRISRPEILREVVERLKGGMVDKIEFVRETKELTLVMSGVASDDEKVTFKFSGVKRVMWEHDYVNTAISGISVTSEDIYLLTHIYGSEIEILSECLRLD